MKSHKLGDDGDDDDDDHDDAGDDDDDDDDDATPYCDSQTIVFLLPLSV